MNITRRDLETAHRVVAALGDAALTRFSAGGPAKEVSDALALSSHCQAVAEALALEQAVRNILACPACGRSFKTPQGLGMHHHAGCSAMKEVRP